MTLNVRRYTMPTLAGVAVALLLSSAAASAQQPPLVPAAPPAGLAPAPAFWELISGYEGDTHGSGYGFFGPSYVRPIRSGLAWTARASANYLSYQFTTHEGEVLVRSPGAGASVGVRLGEKNFFSVSAGPEVRWRRTRLTPAFGTADSRSDTRLGVNVGSEVYANPTSHNNVHAIANYNTADRYTWGRLGFKEQISNRTWEGPNTAFVGVEGIGQGNQDIRSTQVGGFVEYTRVPANVSIMLKAGYKRSTFDVGPALTGPYVSVGFYQRLN